MIDSGILDEMDLPSANPQEELETLSKNIFRPLFPVASFEIRSETFRDKGIDLFIELKKANKHTNFRFAVQLKATESKEVNQDGSISLQLHTYNINYLLNNGMPAYYCLYHKNINTFFFENLNDFVAALNEKDANWQKQKSHVLRFHKVLDSNAINEMYEFTLKKGLFQREINERLALKSASINTTDRILIDGNLNITDDAEIRQLIETGGLMLINEGKWIEIIAVHKKASGNIASTAMYNLVLGIANYYNGNLIDALSFFKTASRLKDELSPDLKSHLIYFETNTKYSIGIITEEEYQNSMKNMEASENIGLYIKIEKAKSNYYNSLLTNSEEGYTKLLGEISEVINNEKADSSIKLNAKWELILLRGSKNNMDYVKTVALVNATEMISGPDQALRLASMQQFIQSQAAWFRNVQEVKEEALNAKNHFAYFNAIINEVKVIYEMNVHTSTISVEQKIPGHPVPLMPDKKPVMDDLLVKITKAYEYYKHIEHIENMVVALSLKYELLHYCDDFTAAKSVLLDIESLIDNYELTDKKKRFEFLKNQGTTHEKFRSFIDGIFTEADKVKREFDEMIAAMTDMDEQERKQNVRVNNSYYIHLFPIGYFQFPKGEKENVYDILNIKNNTLKSVYDNFFNKGIIPVANIHYAEIIQEGPVNGNLADKGIENWRNIYRIRKTFFENKYFRYENTP